MLLQPLCDHARHLVCEPYSVENLHEVARQFKIHPGWFHRTPGKFHYDIPKRRVLEIMNLCKVVSSKELLSIITRPMSDLPSYKDYMSPSITLEMASLAVGLRVVLPISRCTQRELEMYLLDKYELIFRVDPPDYAGREWLGGIFKIGLFSARCDVPGAESYQQVYENALVTMLKYQLAQEEQHS